jgi:nucleotide-binding universal stress UspA family protein
MKVLIALDGSECSNAALRSVTERTWDKDTEFLLLSVVDSPYLDYGFYPPPDGLLDSIRQHLERLVSSNTAILQARFPNLRVMGSVIDGNVKYAIAEKAEEWKADLIVMGSHGRRGLSKLMLGSIAESVLKIAPCSVEIVKEKQTAESRLVSEQNTASDQQSPSDTSSDHQTIKSCDRVI